jgi:uncharacterized membrane-anchored protein YhcB (DUF1043 family)
MKKYLQSLIKEIIPVIIGILIALFINNWNEERKEREYVSKILNSIQSEVGETQEDIEEKLVAHNALMDTLSTYLNDETMSLQKIMNKTNGITLPKVRIHSWKAISNSRIELLDYESLSILANIEEEKNLLNEKSKYLMNFLYNNIGEKSRYKKAILMGLVNDIIGTENWILSEIEELSELQKASR